MAITSDRTGIQPEMDASRSHPGDPPYPADDTGSAVVVLVNAHGIMTYVSPSINAVLGHAPEQLLGLHVRALVHPDDLDGVQGQLEAAGAAPGSSPRAELRLRAHDRSWRWCEGSSTNLLQVPGIEALVITVRARARAGLAPRAEWSEMGASGHCVQFYETDDFLLDSVREYIAAGLDAGDGCIVIASRAHRVGLEARLAASGLDLAAAQARGDYHALDAGDVLAQLLVDGAPQPEPFAAIVGSLITRVAQGHRHVRLFGEMVALLWMEGNQTAAIRLEEAWNDLCTSVGPFSLLCAYAMHGFAREANGAPLIEICKQHSHVIPDESYSTLASPNERLRAIALLQQKAHSLESETVERELAVERLRISENRYRRLFEASTDGILMVDPATHAIADANPGMTELLGYTHEQLLGRPLWRIGLFPDREAALRVLRALRQQRFVRYDALPVRTRDGQPRYVEFVSTQFRANGHDVIQCNVRDITDRKRAEDERRQLEERKNAFISMASHELKTPVTSLKGFTQILHRRLQQQADPQTLLFLHRMDAQLKKLTNLISDLLDLSRMQSGSLVVRTMDVDLDELVRETVENVQMAVTTHHLAVRGATRAHVHGDRDRLGQVLVNLLTNAIKYSPEAETVIVHLSRHDEQAAVAVQDFGIGIAEEDHERVFERFYQVNDGQENTYPGLGIGLFIARTLVEQHGGRLWIESRKGAGSTFRCTLPVVAPAV